MASWSRRSALRPSGKARGRGHESRRRTARLAGFLAFYASNPPPAREEAVSEAERRVPGWLLDQQHAAAEQTPSREFAVVGAISDISGFIPRERQPLQLAKLIEVYKSRYPGRVTEDFDEATQFSGVAVW
jgi:hypothetical protein